MQCGYLSWPPRIGIYKKGSNYVENHGLFDYCRIVGGYCWRLLPFNPQTTIVFELPSPDAVSLRVFDLTGRLVKELIRGEVYGQGQHKTVWNGRDDGGRHVASGIYFYCLEAGEFVQTNKMTLLK